jgi:hypothetical protein
MPTEVEADFIIKEALNDDLGLIIATELIVVNSINLWG